MRLSFVFLICCLAGSAVAGELPASVAAALRDAGVPQSAVGVVVQRVDAPAPALLLNAEQAMNPASTMKLLTTYAALEQLGAGYAWHTDAYSAAPLQNEVLRGDLVLKGMGDPALTLERFWLLLRELRQRGVREIQGDLILDQSYFERSAADPGSFDDQPDRAYNVAPDALLVNYKAVRFDFRPDAGSVAVVASPALPAIRIVNQVQPGAGKCEGWKQRVTRQVQRDGANVTIQFSGRYPAACGVQSLELALFDDTGYISQLFTQLWREMGGVFNGQVRAGGVPDNARLLARMDSLPLADVVRLVNKYSNNVMARQLLLTLGAEQEEAPGTMGKGALAIRNWLAAKGSRYPELVLENGAGLSRSERVSPRHLGEVLINAWYSPVMPAFVSSLPVSAVDGTMKSRLKNTALAGRAYIKTGSLDGVKTMAGYVLDAQDRHWVVVFLVNHKNADKARDAMDALLAWVYAR